MVTLCALSDKLSYARTMSVRWAVNVSARPASSDQSFPTSAVSAPSTAATAAAGAVDVLHPEDLDRALLLLQEDEAAHIRRYRLPIDGVRSLAGQLLAQLFIHECIMPDPPLRPADQRLKRTAARKPYWVCDIWH
mgnify:CR=1 FL=1